jgi:hypothetical protein
MTLSLFTWKRVRDFAAKQVAVQSGTSLRCPGCKRWTYEHADWTFGFSPDEPIATLYCDPCGAKSRWMDGPALIFLDWIAAPQPRAPQTEREGSRDDLKTDHPTSTTRGDTP